MEIAVASAHHRVIADQPNAAVALREFSDAVLALSDDPAPTNVARYLSASQALEDSRPRRRTQARAKTASA